MAGPLDISTDMGGMGSPLGGMISAGMGMISGNPLAIASGVAGLGLSIFGGSQQVSAASQKASAEKAIASYETQQDEIRRRAMELSAHRQQIEVLRNAQRARSLALNNATSQGAQFGSGLQGGYGQIAGAANWNNAGIQQNLGFGEQMFDINKQINAQKMNISDAGSLSATGAGMSKLGGSLMSSFNPIKNLSANFLGGSSDNSSNYTGYAGASTII
jgi:hypothetical protein